MARFVLFTISNENAAEAKALQRDLIAMFVEGLEAYTFWCEQDEMSDEAWDQLDARWPDFFEALVGAMGLHAHRHDEDPDYDEDDADLEYFLSLGLGFESKREVKAAVKRKGRRVYFTVPEGQLPEDDFLRTFLDEAFNLRGDLQESVVSKREAGP